MLADFANATGDREFDGTPPSHGIAVGESPSLVVISNGRVNQTLRPMGRSPDAKFTPEIAAEVCERTGSAAVVEGSITKLGSNYTLGLRARNCLSGDVLEEEQASAARKDEAFRELGEMINQFRARAGESLPRIEREPSLPTEVTTPSLEAWKSYSAALKAQQRRAQTTEAIPLLKRAIEIDPQFPMAYADLGRLYASLGESDLGALNIAKAAEEGLKAIEIHPDYAIGYQNVAFPYIYLNRLPEAEAILRKASERKIEVIEFSLCRYFVAFLMNDSAAMEREVIQRQAQMEAQGLFEHQEALTAAYQGRLKEATRLSDRAVLLSRQAGLRERAARYEGARAVWNALLGTRKEADRSAATTLSLYRSRDTDCGPAFALALLHESKQARKIDADLGRSYPEDTSVQFSFLPALRALDALNEGNAARALEMTQVATPYDLAVPGTAYYTGAFFGALSGLRAGPCLLPYGALSRRSGRVSEDS